MPEHVERTGHVDTFCAEHLPPADSQPDRIWDGIPELDYPARVNCASALLDAMIDAGNGSRPAIRFPGGVWTYDELNANANKIARVLVEDLAIVPGNRVLLRGANTPMLAACWFGVLKAGGVVVCTMAMLRERELKSIAQKAEVTLALTDARVAEDCESALDVPVMRFSVESQSVILSDRNDKVVILSERDKVVAPSERSDKVVILSEQSDKVVILSEQSESKDLHLDLHLDLHRALYVDLNALMRDKPGTFDACDTAADDIAIIAFTSGTTGQGKGTMHSHRDILAITDCFPRYVLKPSRDDLFCGSPPLAFTYALGGLLLFPLRFGACALLLEQATPPHLVKAIAEFRPTICFTAPTAYRAMCGMLGDHDVSSLQ
ncbi:MAG: AMP-binding protein, partial [bacterium]